MLVNKTWASVLTAIKSTPFIVPLLIMEFRAFPPPPPTPTTFILARRPTSGLTKAILLVPDGRQIRTGRAKILLAESIRPAVWAPPPVITRPDGVKPPKLLFFISEATC